MKTQSLIRSSAAALVLLIASACGDSATGPSYQDTMSLSEAGDAGEGAIDLTLSTIAGMNFGTPHLGSGAPAALTRFALAHGQRQGTAPRFQFDLSSPATIRAGLQAASGAGCTTSATGTDGGVFDPIDANDNNVPDDWSVKITCVSHDSLGEDETRVETEVYVIRVKEHTDDLYGFDASSSSDDHEDYTNGNDEKQRYEYVNNVSVTATGATSKYSASYSFDYLDDGVRTTGTRSFELNLAFDPDDTITMGVDPALPDGAVTVNGFVRFLDSEDGNIRFELSTPDPLSYSASCAAGAEEQPFVGGTLTGLLNGDEAIGFSFDWGACGDGSQFTTFGTTP